MTTVKIIQDSFPSNPRDDDNMSLMVCEHGRYRLGDSNARNVLAQKLEVNAGDYSTLELVNMAKNRGLIFYSKPLYLYDHSGITMSTTPFSCPWDSGQVGEVVIFKETLRETFGVKRFGKNIIQQMEEKAERIISSEVSDYDNFISGETYILQILDDNGEVIDSIAGFLGDDVEENGMLEHVSEELKQKLLECKVTYL